MFPPHFLWRVKLKTGRFFFHCSYSSHDAIGKIYIDLTNMLVSENRSTFGGWLPIYDTLLVHAHRGNEIFTNTALQIDP